MTLGSELLSGAYLGHATICQLVTLSLAHTLWQGALLAAVVWGLVHFNRTFSLQWRFSISLCCLSLLGLAPFANAVWLLPHVRSNSVTQASQRPNNDLLMVGIVDLQPKESVTTNPDKLNKSATSSDVSGQASGAHPQPLRVDTLREKRFAGLSLVSISSGIYSLLAVGYLVGLLLMFVRLFRGIREQSRLARLCVAQVDRSNAIGAIEAAASRAANAIGFHLRVSIALADGVGMALIVGTLRPIILINSALLFGLTPAQTEQVIAHELAHLARWDPLTLFWQRIIETMLFFNPATWSISRSVSELREMCCDQCVATAYSPVGYATTLVECASLRPSSQITTLSPPIRALFAIGELTGQLTRRVCTLLNVEIPRHRRMPIARHHTVFHHMSVLACGVLVVVVTLSLFAHTSKHGDQYVPWAIQSVRPDWPWQRIDANEINETALLVGGRKLLLEKNLPADLTLNAMIDPAECRIAQWQFGDLNSTRVAIVCEVTNGQIDRLYVDVNRDRVIDESEQMGQRLPSGRGWLVELDTEVHDLETILRSSRQIAITSSKDGTFLRVSTLGFASGELCVGDKCFASRRIDNDGDGLPTSRRDELWIDHDQDGKFDLLQERFSIGPWLKLGEEMYALQSDRFGQELTLRSAATSGSVRFSFALADRKAQLVQLEGCLRDENGLFVPIRMDESPISLLPGRYCVESLFVKVRDARNEIWQMTLSRAFDRGWFDVVENVEREIKLIESLQFTLRPTKLRGTHGDIESVFQSYLHDPNGLTVTDFAHQSPANENQKRFGQNGAIVHFAISRPDGRKVVGVDHECDTGFF